MKIRQQLKEGHSWLGPYEEEVNPIKILSLCKVRCIISHFRKRRRSFANFSVSCGAASIQPNAFKLDRLVAECQSEVVTWACLLAVHRAVDPASTTIPLQSLSQLDSILEITA